MTRPFAQKPLRHCPGPMIRPTPLFGRPPLRTRLTPNLSKEAERRNEFQKFQ